MQDCYVGDMLVEQNSNKQQLLSKAIDRYLSHTLTNEVGVGVGYSANDYGQVLNIRDKKGSKTYHIDIVNLPQYLCSPEILTVVANKVFTKKTIDGKSSIVLKKEYEEHKFLTPSEDPYLDDGLCIPLSDELLRCCNKFMDKTIKYAILCDSPYESLEQQIENFILSGRAQRIVSYNGCTGPCVENTVSIILKENNKRIKYANILNGSFPKDKDPIVNKQRWTRVIID